MKKQNYLFLGSSITYGSGSSGISVADMFAEDYAKLEYQRSAEGHVVRDIKYLRRLTTSNDDTLDGNTAFVEPLGDYVSMTIYFNHSDHVYKVACNGYKLAHATTESSPEITSYVHLLLTMINQHKLISSSPDGAGTIVKEYDGLAIDRVFIQLSTNDAGQTDTIFGDIDTEGIDDTTSYGSIRYLVKLCKDTWGNDCRITFYVCPRCEMPGSYGIRYAELREGLLLLRDKYQNFDVIDLWSNDKVTSLVNGENYSSYLMPDKVHPTEMGYERIFFPEFRKHME